MPPTAGTEREVFQAEFTGAEAESLAAALRVYVHRRAAAAAAATTAATTAATAIGPAGLGALLAWIYVNRPVDSRVIVRRIGPDTSAGDDAITFGPPPAGVPVAFANRRELTTDPDACVDLFHLHCHFDGDTEPAARALLADTERALAAAGAPACHSYVWHEQNGPHVAWSWELWVDSATALGVGARHLMRARPRAAGGALRCMVHCDTDQEYTDHAARMAFVGPPDFLDLHFFRSPDPAHYQGPLGPRRTDARRIQTMGQSYDRATLADVYPNKSPAADTNFDQHGSHTSDHQHHHHGNDNNDNDGSSQAGPPALVHLGGTPERLPALFLPHGSPPIPLEECATVAWLQRAAAALPRRPKAIVFMSPHFRSMPGTFEVSTAVRPRTKYDFDEDTNPDARARMEQLTYPCRGAPAVARRVAELLRAAGLECEENEDQGLDHGVWTPLYSMFPDADVPVASLSVSIDNDTAAHMAAGRALQVLREEGVLLVGSGEVVHNVPTMGSRSSPQQPWCLGFEGWFERAAGVATETATATTAATTTTVLRQLAVPPPADLDALLRWKEVGPHAAVAHPADGSPGEHLLPWFFAYGAGGGGQPGAIARCVSKEYLGSLPMSAYTFDCPVVATRPTQAGPAAPRPRLRAAL